MMSSLSVDPCLSRSESFREAGRQKKKKKKKMEKMMMTMTKKMMKKMKMRILLVRIIYKTRLPQQPFRYLVSMTKIP